MGKDGRQRQQVRRRSPLWWGLGLSALLHLSVLLYLVRVEAPLEPEPPPTPVELQWVHVAPPPEPEGPPAAPAPAPKAPRPQLPPSNLEDSAVLPQSPDTPLAGPQPPSAPGPSLLPNPDRMWSQLSPAPQPVPRGQTLSPQGPEDPQKAQEQERSVVEGRVTGWAKDTLSVHRVESGVVDTHIREVGTQLASRMSINPKLELQWGKAAQKMIAEYQKSLAQYGAWGNPGGVVTDSTLPNNVEALRDQSERLRRYAEESLAKEYVVVLELRQDPTGRVEAVKILRSSHNQPFDEHVVEVAHTAELTPLPDYLSARYPGGIRTVWEFRGKHQILKKVRQFDLKSPGDAAYLAGMGLVSALMGAPFDETTMDLYVLDLRNPEFSVKSRLLQFY